MLRFLIIALIAAPVFAQSAPGGSPSSPSVSVQQLIEVAKGTVSDARARHKFGALADADPVTGGVPVWTVDGAYPWAALAGAGETLQISGGATDVGTLLSSGTADSGSSATTLVDASATFSSDGVAAGDLLIDDTAARAYSVSSVDSETQITILEADLGSGTARDAELDGIAYRIATPASTGASVIAVFGHDGSSVEASECVILNGATDVETTGSYRRVYRSVVLGAGSNGLNDAAIDIQDNGATTTVAEIRAGYSQTEMAVWSVPAGNTYYMTQVGGSEGSDKRAAFSIYWRPPGGVFRPANGSLSANGDTPPPLTFGGLPLVFPERSDIECRVFADEVNASVTCHFDGWTE